MQTSDISLLIKQAFLSLFSSYNSKRQLKLEIKLSIQNVFYGESFDTRKKFISYIQKITNSINQIVFNLIKEKDLIKNYVVFAQQTQQLNLIVYFFLIKKNYSFQYFNPKRYLQNLNKKTGQQFQKIIIHPQQTFDILLNQQQLKIQQLKVLSGLFQFCKQNRYNYQIIDKKQYEKDQKQIEIVLNCIQEIISAVNLKIYMNQYVKFIVQENYHNFAMKQGFKYIESQIKNCLKQIIDICEQIIDICEQKNRFFFKKMNKFSYKYYQSNLKYDNLTQNKENKRSNQQEEKKYFQSNQILKDCKQILDQKIQFKRSSVTFLRSTHSLYLLYGLFNSIHERFKGNHSMKGIKPYELVLSYNLMFQLINTAQQILWLYQIKKTKQQFVKQNSISLDLRNISQKKYFKLKASIFFQNPLKEKKYQKKMRNFTQAYKQQKQQNFYNEFHVYHLDILFLILSSWIKNKNQNNQSNQKIIQIKLKTQNQQDSNILEKYLKDNHLNIYKRNLFKMQDKSFNIKIQNKELKDQNLNQIFLSRHQQAYKNINIQSIKIQLNTLVKQFKILSLKRNKIITIKNERSQEQKKILEESLQKNKKIWQSIGKQQILKRQQSKQFFLSVQQFKYLIAINSIQKAKQKQISTCLQIFMTEYSKYFYQQTFNNLQRFKITLLEKSSNFILIESKKHDSLNNLYQNLRNQIRQQYSIFLYKAFPQQILQICFSILSQKSFQQQHLSKLLYSLYINLLKYKKYSQQKKIFKNIQIKQIYNDFEQFVRDIQKKIAFCQQELILSIQDQEIQKIKQFMALKPEQKQQKFKKISSQIDKVYKVFKSQQIQDFFNNAKEKLKSFSFSFYMFILSMTSIDILLEICIKQKLQKNKNLSQISAKIIYFLKILNRFKKQFYQAIAFQFKQWQKQLNILKEINQIVLFEKNQIEKVFSLITEIIYYKDYQNYKIEDFIKKMKDYIKHFEELLSKFIDINQFKQIANYFIQKKQLKNIDEDFLKFYIQIFTSVQTQIQLPKRFQSIKYFNPEKVQKQIQSYLLKQWKEIIQLQLQNNKRKQIQYNIEKKFNEVKDKFAMVKKHFYIDQLQNNENQKYLYQFTLRKLPSKQISILQNPILLNINYIYQSLKMTALMLKIKQQSLNWISIFIQNRLISQFKDRFQDSIDFHIDCYRSRLIQKLNQFDEILYCNQKYKNQLTSQQKNQIQQLISAIKKLLQEKKKLYQPNSRNQLYGLLKKYQKKFSHKKESFIFQIKVFYQLVDTLKKISKQIILKNNNQNQNPSSIIKIYQLACLRDILFKGVRYAKSLQYIYQMNLTKAHFTLRQQLITLIDFHYSNLGGFQSTNGKDFFNIKFHQNQFDQLSYKIYKNSKINRKYIQHIMFHELDAILFTSFFWKDLIYLKKNSHQEQKIKYFWNFIVGKGLKMHINLNRYFKKKDSFSTLKNNTTMNWVNNGTYTKQSCLLLELSPQDINLDIVEKLYKNRGQFFPQFQEIIQNEKKNKKYRKNEKSQPIFKIEGKYKYK